MKKVFPNLRIRIIFLIFILLIISFALFIIIGYRSALIPDSYLPKNNSPLIHSLPSGPDQFILKNPWYKIEVDQNGRIAVKTPDGKGIISSLTYYSDFEGEKDKWGLNNISVNLNNDSTIEIKGTALNDTKVDLLIKSNKNLPKIDFDVRSEYSRNTEVLRDALVALFDIPVSEIYLKNRKVDTANFEREYWLQKQGARFGINERSAMIYHSPLVSSLQILPEKRLLFVNLDFNLDHPFVNIPYQKNGAGKWINLSSSYYPAGSQQENSFSINIGPFPRNTPRLMLVPYGFKAGYVFTEHADGGNIRTQRAAYFGSETITKATNATGGFVAHRIPVTKSVFYTGPVTSSGASIYEDGKVSPLLDFLDQIYATGLYDICLHTPENISSNRQTLEKSIKFMAERYNTVTWIDHGFYTGQSNREALVCNGLDTFSRYYAADLWEKYKTQYFWSPAVEMIKNREWVSVGDNVKKFKFLTAYKTLLQHYLSPKDLRSLNFYQLAQKLKTNYSYGKELNTLEYNSGNATPTPLFWQSPTRTREFYSWATDQDKDYGSLSENVVKKEQEQLKNLIKNQGVFINHGYFVRNRVPNDKVLVTKNGKLVVNPNFDRILTTMAQMRDNGDLYLTTVKDLLNYWIMLDKVSFEYLTDGSINVINNNDTAIKGLSLIIKKANLILVDGQKPSFKNLQDQTIFWFDIQPHSKVKLLIQ